MTKNISELNNIMWIDGKFINVKDANVSFFTNTLHYGSAVFEGTRAYNGKIFKEKEHNERLYASAELLEMNVPIDIETFSIAQREVLRRNNLSDAYIRPLIWCGSATMGLETLAAGVHIGIAAWEWPSYFPEEKINSGLSLRLSEWQRPSPLSAPTASKASGLYIICSMAKNKASRQGYDDALMLDYRGYVAECTGANIFFIRDKTIVTPKADCFLNGITRQTIINEIAPQIGYNVIERHMLPEEINEYEQCFITGTATEVMPIKEIEGLAQYNVSESVLNIRNAYLEKVSS